MAERFPNEQPEAIGRLEPLLLSGGHREVCDGFLFAEQTADPLARKVLS